MPTTYASAGTSRPELAALHNAWLFSACSDSELDEIENLGTHVEVEAGRTLVRAEDREPACFVLLHGQAVVERAGRVIGHAGDGSVVGVTSLIDGGVPGVTVIAAMDMQVLALDRDDVAAFLASDKCWSVRHRLEVIATEQRRLR